MMKIAGCIICIGMLVSMGAGSAIGNATDPLYNPDSSDGCMVVLTFIEASGGFICGMLPLTHAIARINVVDDGLLSSGTCQVYMDAHASVHPWIPDTYDYTLYVEVDGERTDGPLDDIDVIGTQSFSHTSESFQETAKVFASVINRHTGGELVNDDEIGEVRIFHDSATASLTYTCGESSWKNRCDIDGWLEEWNPPSRCDPEEFISIPL